MPRIHLIFAAAAGALVAAAAPAAQYELIELAQAEDIHATSKSSPQLRVGGASSTGTYSPGPGTSCTLEAPAYWDVTAPGTSVAPTLLPKLRADRSARIRAVSADGSVLGGSDWDGDAATTSCIDYPRPALWLPTAAQGWTEVVLDLPGGATYGAVTGVANGGDVVVGYAGWSQLDPVQRTHVYSWRAVVWRRSSTGTWDAELVPDPATCSGCADDTSQATGTDPTGGVVTIAVDDDARDAQTTMRPSYVENLGLGWSDRRPLALPAGALGGGARPGRVSAFVGSTYYDGYLTRAALWPASTSVALELPGLNGPSTKAWDQSSRGTVVGTADVVVRRTQSEVAVKWEPPYAGIVDLNTVTATNGWTLETTVGIDDAGRVAGRMSVLINRVRITSCYALLPTGN